jgi:dCTP deaminase
VILKADRIAHLLETGEPEGDPLIITPRPDLEKFKNSGAGSVDLRLGCWFAMLRQTRASMLDVGPTVSETLTAEALTKLHYVRFGDKFFLHPRAFVLGSTLEWIRMPKNIAGYVTSRSSWGRRGLIIATATGVHPGFTGCLTLELFNSGEVPIALYPGMAISQFFMHTVATDSDKIDRSALAGRRRPFLGTIELDEIAVKLASQL